MIDQIKSIDDTIASASATLMKREMHCDEALEIIERLKTHLAGYMGDTP
jgi:hypothetical protein